MTKTATATKVAKPRAKKAIATDPHANQMWTEEEVAQIHAMKRADKRRAARELEYSQRDMRLMLAVTASLVTLVYTSLWLIAKVYGA